MRLLAGMITVGLAPAALPTASPMTADVEITVESPVAGTTYYASLPGGEVSAAVGLNLGEGPWAAAVRAAPSAFELCVHWGSGSGGRGDGGVPHQPDALQDDLAAPAGPACRVLVSLPGHVDASVPNLRPSAVAPGHHVFVAHLRATPGGFDSYVPRSSFHLC